MTEADLAYTIAMFRGALAANPEKQDFTLIVTRPMVEIILDVVVGMDPDMPPRPICKILGPLTGDIMMNAKLNRLDEIANSLGPNVIRLAMIADQLEKI